MIHYRQLFPYPAAAALAGHCFALRCRSAAVGVAAGRADRTAMRPAGGATTKARRHVEPDQSGWNGASVRFAC
jgi:hypothetical protein